MNTKLLVILVVLAVSVTVEGRSHNVYKTSGGGGWGGQCQCPDGNKYWVGDAAPWYCRKLACKGGKKLSCTHRSDKRWSKRSVTCSSAGKHHSRHSSKCRCRPCPRGRACTRMCIRECYDARHHKWTGGRGSILINKHHHKAQTYRQKYYGCVRNSRKYCRRHRVRCRRGRASRGQCCNMTGWCRRHSRTRRTGRKNKSWWNKNQSKYSTWNRYRHGWKNVKSQMKRLMKSCMKKLRDREYCNYKVKKAKAKSMKNVHQKNWKYNMLRWDKKLSRGDYRRRLDYIRKHKNKWNRNPAALKKAIAEFKKKYGNHRSKYDRDHKRQYDKLKQTLSRRKRYMNTYRGWKTYKKQQHQWEASPAGKCLKARIVHFQWMKAGHNYRHSRRLSNSYKEVQRACGGVKQYWLPFSNRGCMQKLDVYYAKAMEDQDEFLKKESDDTLNKFKSALQSSENILKRSCLNWSFKRHAPHCKKYMEKRLASDARKLKRRFRKSHAKRWLGNRVNDFQRIYDTMMDERFWLNAPSDCGIEGEKKIDDEDNEKMSWLKNLRKIMFDRKKESSWKKRQNYKWKRENRGGWRRNRRGRGNRRHWNWRDRRHRGQNGGNRRHRGHRGHRGGDDDKHSRRHRGHRGHRGGNNDKHRRHRGHRGGNNDKHRRHRGHRGHRGDNEDGDDRRERRRNRRNRKHHGGKHKHHRGGNDDRRERRRNRRNHKHKHHGGKRNRRHHRGNDDDDIQD